MEAPTTCSILLAGLLLKVGVYGVIKIVTTVKTSLIPISIIAVIGLVFSGFLSSLSRDSKIIAAYSSITHINVGLYGANVRSLSLMESNYLLCLGHGYVSVIMFYFVGTLYHHRGSRLLH